MSKARTLADFISDGSEFADGTISVAEVSGAAPLASPTFTGTVTSSGDVIVNSDGSNASGAIQINNSSTHTYGKAIEAYSSGISDGKYHQILMGKEGATNNTGTINFKYNSDGSNTNYISFGLWGNDEVVTATGAGNVGISNQAPVYTLDVAGTTSADQYLIDAISATISDTAVDIFVYDTRKDSDGGAWRKRTQHTSWYNETLNTATRGSRKEFPAVAVIVAESNQVTIYDGDDPDLPMWMVFNTGGNWNHILVSTSGYVTCVAMLNGHLVIGRNLNTGWQLTKTSFVDDSSYGYKNAAHGTSDGVWTGGIVARNGDGSYYDNGVASNILSPYNNDVAMTVLPNAPIDAATGLPVPTIAVATDGGVSVIKDDGTVVDSTATNQFTNIAFAGNDMWVADKAFADEIRYYKNVSGLADGFDHDFTYWGGSVTTASNTGLPQPWWNNSSSVYDEFAVTDYGIAARQHSNGFFALNPDATHKNGLGAYIASSYNTGWMNGDIKLATLSDTDDTNVTGSELVTNGTFDSNINDWQARGNASNSWNSSGYIDIDRNGESADAGRNVAYQVISGFTVGATYTASAEVIALSNGFTLTASLSTLGSNIVEEGAEITAAGIATVTFVATATTLALGLGARGNQNATATVDNISVRLAEEDRSVNGNGLQVFGTVTKSAVATGADLVGYSGFGVSDYLEQPYNSDLDFGTGDFCYMSWVQFKTGNSYLFDRDATDGSGARTYVNRSGNTDDFINFKSVTLTGAYAISDSVAAQWNHVVCMRQNGIISIYWNGSLYGTGTNTEDLTNTSAVLGIGTRVTSRASSTAAEAIALFRVSATAPSPEQIKKIYEDEKVLFQENAQATLYGSSDAVTALAYDDTTELLHVGTSAGRSVFQGLRRVDNTTNAVGSAISASNGLVADE